MQSGANTTTVVSLILVYGNVYFILVITVFMLSLVIGFFLISYYIEFIK